MRRNEHKLRRLLAQAARGQYLTHARRSLRFLEALLVEQHHPPPALALANALPPQQNVVRRLHRVLCAQRVVARVRLARREDIGIDADDAAVAINQRPAARALHLGRVGHKKGRLGRRRRLLVVLSFAVVLLVACGERAIHAACRREARQCGAVTKQAERRAVAADGEHKVALFHVGIGERQRRRRLDQGRQLQKRQMIVDTNNLARVRLHEIVGGKLDLYAAAGAKSDRVNKVSRSMATAHALPQTVWPTVPCRVFGSKTRATDCDSASVLNVGKYPDAAATSRRPYIVLAARAIVVNQGWAL